MCVYIYTYTYRQNSTIFRQVQEHGMKFLLSEHYVGTLYLAAGSLPYMSTCMHRTDSKDSYFFSPVDTPNIDSPVFLHFFDALRISSLHFDSHIFFLLFLNTLNTLLRVTLFSSSSFFFFTSKKFEFVLPLTQPSRTTEQFSSTLVLFFFFINNYLLLLALLSL